VWFWNTIKRKGGVKWSTLLVKGFGEKALIGLLSSYLQQQNLPLVGVGLDANYIYNGILGAFYAQTIPLTEAKAHGIWIPC